MEFPWGLSGSRSRLSSCLQPSLESGGELDWGHWEASGAKLQTVGFNARVELGEAHV